MVPNTISAGETPGLQPIILVVEDDVLIRAATARFLRESGYTVVEAIDVAEATAILTAMPVSVVFTDVKLPGERSGVDLFEIVRRQHPTVKVLFTSGVVPAKEVASTGAPFIRKPYFLFEVDRQIKVLLGRPH